jgi:DNA-binding XRE family transcriptional regulator
MREYPVKFCNGIFSLDINSITEYLPGPGGKAMLPKEWREKHRKTQEEVAGLLGTTQGTVSKIEHDGTISDDLAAKFEEISDGEVTFLELKHPKYKKVPNEE